MGQNIGKVGLSPQGKYESGRTYVRLMTVSHNGNYWVAVKDVPANAAPYDGSAYWHIMAEKGIQGPQGQSYVDREMVPIVDNLTQGGSANVLSAEQGKILKQELTELESEMYDHTSITGSAVDMSDILLSQAFFASNGTITYIANNYNIYGRLFEEKAVVKISRNFKPAAGAGSVAIANSIEDIAIGNKFDLIVNDSESDADKYVLLEKGQYLMVSENISSPRTNFFFTTDIKSVDNEIKNIGVSVSELESKTNILESEVKNDSIYGYEDGQFFEISNKVVDSAFINGDGVIAEIGNDVYNIWVHQITKDSDIRVKRNLPSSGGSNRIYVINDLSELYIGATLKNKIDDGETQPIDIVFSVQKGQYIVWGGQTNEKKNSTFNYVTLLTIKEAVAQIENVWKGKKWAVIGDSITEVNARSNKRYIEYIEDATGIEGVNLGISGTGYVRDEKFFDRLAKVPTDCDVITFFGGGNDKGELPIGDIADNGTDTFCGWVNNTFDRCIELYPLIPFGVIVPFPWRGCMPYDTNGNGKAFRQICEALIQICERRSIPCLDLYHSSGLFPNNADFLKVAYSKDTIAKKTLSPSDTSVLITAENIEYYQSKSDDTLSIGDYVDLGGGVHPDENGHKIIAPKIKVFLETLVL